MVRCKMRLLEVNEVFVDPTRGEPHTFVARYLPVMPKGPAYPDGCEENRAFWNATPAGVLTVKWRGRPTDLQVGAFYYVDLAQADKNGGPGMWDLWEVANHGHAGLVVKFQLPWQIQGVRQGGALELDIRNPTACAHFLGKAGTSWSVEVSPAA